MARKKASLFGYTHIKNNPRKRPGRHAKHYGKRTPKRKKSRGQGK